MYSEGNTSEFESLNIDSSSTSSSRNRGRKYSKIKQFLCSPYGCLAAFMVAMVAISFGQLIVLSNSSSSNTGSSKFKGITGDTEQDLSTVAKVLMKQFGQPPTYTKLTDFKQHVATDGIMNVYTTKSDRAYGIYFEVYESALGDENLFVRSDLVTRSQGYDPMLHTQFDGNNPVWYFKLSEDLQKIELYEKQLNLRTSDQQLKQLLEEGAVDRWLGEFPIVDQFSNQEKSETNKDPSYVFDAQAFVETEVFGVHLPQDLTLHRLVKVSNFPSNINFIIESAAAISNENDDEDVGIMVSLAKLPKIPMVGRQADPRVGYFTTHYTDLGEHPKRNDVRPSRRIDTDVRLINRWRLEKSTNCDSNNLCEPIKPIVYYIDPSVPERWRKYVAKGVTAWKKAFEAIGFKNTPRAVLPGSKDWPKDYTAGDIRYATISFAISREYVFSVGPSISDPRSGEIIDADIGFAQEWVKAFTTEIGTHNIDTSSKARRRRNYNSHGKTPARKTSKDGKDDDHDHHHHHHHHHHNHNHAHSHIDSRHGCGRLNSLMESRSLLGLSFGQNEVPDHVIGNGLADVTTHEVGHTLGLRHNFKGSSSIPFNQLNNKSYTDENGITASIMDYVAANIASDPAKQNQDNYFPGANTVGGYDKIAIQYGYTVVPDEHQGIELPVLKNIAKLVETKKYAFATDGDTDEQDPLARRYDLTNDPIKYSNDRFDLVYRLRKGLTTRGLECGDGYSCVYGLEHMLLRNLFTNTRNALNFIGGHIISHRFPTGSASESSDAPVTIVAPAYIDQALGTFKRFFHDQYYFPTSTNTADGGKMKLPFMVKYMSGYDPTYPLFFANILKNHDTYSKALLDFVLNDRVLQNIEQTNYLAKAGVQGWKPTTTGSTSTPITPSDVANKINVYYILTQMFKIVWFGPNKEQMSQHQFKWNVQRYFISKVAHFAYYKMDEWDDTLDVIDVLPVSAPIQAQALQTLYDIRGNVTEQWEKANGPVKRYYEDLICLTRSNRDHCELIQDNHAHNK
jgi:hypothetical protein